MTAYEVMGSHCNDESQTSKKKNCFKKLTKGKKKKPGKWDAKVSAQ